MKMVLGPVVVARNLTKGIGPIHSRPSRGSFGKVALNKRPRLGHASIDLGHGLGNLCPATVVGGCGQLSLELGTREPKRLERPDSLRVARRLRRILLLAFSLQLLHTLLNPRICIDQSFACVSHVSPEWYPMTSRSLPYIIR
jgi:hypothetical protein